MKTKQKTPSRLDSVRKWKPSASLLTDVRTFCWKMSDSLYHCCNVTITFPFFSRDPGTFATQIDLSYLPGGERMDLRSMGVYSPERHLYCLSVFQGRGRDQHPDRPRHAICCNSPHLCYYVWCGLIKACVTVVSKRKPDLQVSTHIGRMCSRIIDVAYKLTGMRNIYWHVGLMAR